MKRFLSALALCSSLLVLLSLVLLPDVTAKSEEDVLSQLLKLPAPPPPNPFIKKTWWMRVNSSDNKDRQPPDDGPIEDLIDYWSVIRPRPLYYSPEPSAKVRARLLKEIEREPMLLPPLLNVFNDDPDAAEVIKRIYDSEGTTGVFDRYLRREIRKWLTYNSPYFSDDLYRMASRITDSEEYISGQPVDLLALTRVDYDRARPIIDRLYGDSSLKTSRVLATWALYRRAHITGSTSDIERYRNELKKIVEDRSALPGMRDLAMDALVAEKEWPGRDEWYFSLFSDETLNELRVEGAVHTGLTTLIHNSPPGKYSARMIELLKSDNIAVRSAAVRNLLVNLHQSGPEVIRALLPWLEDPKWANDTDDARGRLVRRLAELEIPESVPGLIKLLDEKHFEPRYAANAAVTSTNTVRMSATNAAAGVVVRAANAASSAANSASNTYKTGNYTPAEPIEYYPYRSSAIYALTMQKDARAVQPLRRVLPQVTGYERTYVVKALLACNGFTIAEQLDALDFVARQYGNEEVYTDPVKVPVYNGDVQKVGPPTAAEIRAMLGQHLIQGDDLISDALARATVDRIETLDRRDPQLAAAYRRIVIHWKNDAIKILLLRDIKRGIADVDTIVRILAQRKMLREKLPSDVFSLRSGTPMAVGLAACMLEDAADYETIINYGDADAKVALLACARLIRAPLNVEAVAAHLSAKEPRLAKAAEKYLISEDSPAARSIVLSRYPNEAMILGARTAFAGEGREIADYVSIAELFQSVGNEMLYDGWIGTSDEDELVRREKALREEVKNDATLIGIYSYNRHYIRIYNDRVMFSWDEDDSRYRERPMKREEFDEIKSYLTEQRADELPPFLYCGGEYCPSDELLMLSRGGGRRVFLAGAIGSNSSSRPTDFFTGLDKYFESLKREPATLKYAMSRDIRNLEIVLAREDLRVETVWGQGGDIEIVASETRVREKVRQEIDALEEEAEIDPNSAVGNSSLEIVRNKAFEKRRYEGYSWYRIVGDKIVGTVAQPPGVEFIPKRDGLSVPVEKEQWKARAAGFEIRASPDGLYKVVAGRLTKLLSGNYQNPVVSPDGRWAIVTKIDDAGGVTLMRVNLVNRKEYPIETEEYSDWRARAYVGPLNRFIVEIPQYYGDYDDYYYDAEAQEISPYEINRQDLRLVDIATGKLLPVRGELRPFAQQTFRPLQIASRPGELWAALPNSEKHETSVGRLNTRTLTFREVIRVPKITFNSMQMWVDEPRKKLYFVYRGHLLRLPLPD